MPKVKKVRHIIPISGKDSLCTAIVQKTLRPLIPYEYLFCDVRMELPETYAWLDLVEKALGITLIRVGKSLEEVIAEKGMLPNHTYRFCTRTAKIFPMQDYVGSDRAVQYLGFRADEKDRIPPTGVERINITNKFPLIETGVDLPGVYSILDSQKVMPPVFFWQRLYDEVYSMCSDASKEFMETAKPWTRNYLFSWRSRSNCFMCFYQRLYEWVGLLEHHPVLFARAEEMERVYGSGDSEYRMEKFEDYQPRGDYTFLQGWPLKKIRAGADGIFKKRVQAVYEAVVSARHKTDNEVDQLALTSCGAYCGK